MTTTPVSSSTARYLVTAASTKDASVINQRRGATGSVPGMRVSTSCRASDELFASFGLEEYMGCVTAEMSSRPIPHVFEASKVAALTSLCEEWYPYLLGMIMPQLKPPLQTLSKTSRLGHPEFDRPDDKRGALLAYMSGLFSDLDGTLEDAYIIINVRLQAESRRKEREFLFVNDDGEVYDKTVTEEDRKIEVSDLGERIASRTRLVFNMPMANLVKQVLDTAIHKVLLKYPAFGHNLYANAGREEISGDVLAFDVAHFERHTAAVCRLRAQLIGGHYGDINQWFADIPFLCPSDTRRRAFFLRVNREAGYMDQFASGDSAVAPAQKEVLWMLYANYFRTIFHLTREAALEMVAQGGPSGWRIKNYGDDNTVFTSQRNHDPLLSYLREYLEAQREEPPKFLGFVRTPGRWTLPISSYLLKTYLNERRPGSNFRKFPYYGWVEKRKTYSTYGDPRVASDVFPAEDALLERVGLPWTKILGRAARDEREMIKEGAVWPKSYWTGEKDYALTEEEKIATGLFQGLYPVETKPIMEWLLPDGWKHKLAW